MHASGPHYASRGARLGGQLLDGLILLAAFVPAFVLTTISEAIGQVALIPAVIFAFAYYFFADAMKGGQSFGKRAVNTAVVHSETRKPCTAGQAFVRNVLLYVLGPIDWVFIFGERHQRLGDKLAHTIVLEAPGGVVAPDGGFSFPTAGRTGVQGSARPTIGGK